MIIKPLLRIFVLLTALLPITALAAVTTGGNPPLPSQVSQGRAFVGHWLKTGSETAGDRVLWQGKEIPLQSRGEGEHLVVEVLLGMPMDAVGQQPLTLYLDGARYDFSITALPVPWKEQVLAVEPKYVEPPADVAERIAREAALNKELLAAVRPERDWTLPFTRPVKGGVSSSFGGKRIFNGSPRSAHRGTDMRGPEGTPILAVAAGTVVLAEPQYFSGNAVFVDHGQGVISLYAHLSSFDVRTGERVEKGQQIGRVGATGRVTGPHLHLGIMVQGVAVDAMPLFGPGAFPETVGGPTKEDPVRK